jgi:presenilin-like A22 family membrane protease
LKLTKYTPFIGMAFLLLLVQLVAFALSEPFEANEFKAFSNPEATSNAVLWIIAVLAFTLFIFIVIKLNKRWIIQLIILLTVISTFYYVFFALLSAFLSVETNFILTTILSIGLTVLLYKYPEWYVIDFVGIIIGAGASSIFGISLAIRPTLVLLILLAVYDYIAVYRTKHMVALAEGVMDLKLPILLVFPKHLKYSFLTEKFDKEEREAFFMGLGDAVIPPL